MMDRDFEKSKRRVKPAEDIKKLQTQNIFQKQEEVSIKKRLCNFLSSTGCHGCNKLLQTSILQRCLWAGLIFSSLVFLIYSIVGEFQQFYSYPTFTKFSYALMEEMIFPTVIVCNKSPYNLVKLNFIKEDSIFKKYVHVSNSLTSLNQHDLNQSRLSAKEFKEEMWKVAHDINMFITSVSFDSQQLNVSSTMKRTTTSFGPCFSFNSDGKITTRVSGRNQNLLMGLNIDQLNYTSNIMSAGIEVLIQEPGNAPDLRNLGTMVQPGVSAEIRISKVQSKFLPYPYQSTDGRYCISSEDGKYSKKRCIDKCVVRAIFASCQCILIEDLIDGPICLPGEVTKCYLPMYTQLQGNASFKKECECKDSCETTVYESTMSFSQFPSDATVNMFAPGNLLFPPDASSMRNNLLMVRIYFENLRKTTIEQIPKYESVADVLANLGGQMGLFLGISILTVVEFVEMVSIVICAVLKRIWQTRHLTRPLSINSFKKRKRENQNK